MTNTKELFDHYPKIRIDESMIGTDFYKFLDSGVEYVSFYSSICAYLTPKGFDTNNCYLNERQVQLHKSVFEYYYWLKHY